MKTRWIEDIREFHGLAKEWDQALGIAGEDNPFLASDFISAWWRHYSDHKGLMLFSLWKNGQIAAGLPLYGNPKGLRKSLHYIGGYAANVTHGFSIENDIRIMDYLLPALQEREKLFELIVLERVLNNNPLAESAENKPLLLRYGYRSQAAHAGFNGIIDLNAGYEAVLQRMGKRLRRYLASGRRNAAQLGELVLCPVRGSGPVSELFKEYISLSIQSFRARGKKSAFENRQNCRFFAELFTIFNTKGKLDAHRLMAGSHTLGISFGYRFGKGFKWILTAFNPRFRSLRPGHLLIDALVKEAIRRGDPYFDMYYGGELFYKQQWCTEMIPLKRIEIYRSSLLNSSLHRFGKAFRSNAVLLNLARRIRTALQILCGR